MELPQASAPEPPLLLPPTPACSTLHAQASRLHLSPSLLPTPSTSTPCHLPSQEADTGPPMQGRETTELPQGNFPNGSIWLIALTLLSPSACQREAGPPLSRNIDTGSLGQHGPRTHSCGSLRVGPWSFIRNCLAHLLPPN